MNYLEEDEYQPWHEPSQIMSGTDPARDSTGNNTNNPSGYNRSFSNPSTTVNFQNVTNNSQTTQNAGNQVQYSSSAQSTNLSQGQFQNTFQTANSVQNQRPFGQASQAAGTNQQPYQRPLASVRPMVQSVPSQKLNSPQHGKCSGPKPMNPQGNMDAQPSTSNQQPDGVILSMPDNVQIKSELFDDDFFGDQFGTMDMQSEFGMDHTFDTGTNFSFPNQMSGSQNFIPHTVQTSQTVPPQQNFSNQVVKQEQAVQGYGMQQYPHNQQQHQQQQYLHQQANRSQQQQHYVNPMPVKQENAGQLQSQNYRFPDQSENQVAVKREFSQSMGMMQHQPQQQMQRQPQQQHQQQQSYQLPVTNIKQETIQQSFTPVQVKQEYQGDQIMNQQSQPQSQHQPQQQGFGGACAQVKQEYHGNQIGQTKPQQQQPPQQQQQGFANPVNIKQELLDPFDEVMNKDYNQTMNSNQNQFGTMQGQQMNPNPRMQTPQPSQQLVNQNVNGQYGQTYNQTQNYQGQNFHNTGQFQQGQTFNQRQSFQAGHQVQMTYQNQQAVGQMPQTQVPQQSYQYQQQQQQFPQNQWQGQTVRAVRQRGPGQVMQPRAPGQIRPVMPGPQNVQTMDQQFAPQPAQPRARQPRARGRGRGRQSKAKTPRLPAPDFNNQQQQLTDQQFVQQTHQQQMGILQSQLQQPNQFQQPRMLQPRAQMQQQHRLPIQQPQRLPNQPQLQQPVQQQPRMVVQPQQFQPQQQQRMTLQQPQQQQVRMPLQTQQQRMAVQQPMQRMPLQQPVRMQQGQRMPAQQAQRMAFQQQQQLRMQGQQGQQVRPQQVVVRVQNPQMSTPQMVSQAMTAAGQSIRSPGIQTQPRLQTMQALPQGLQTQRQMAPRSAVGQVRQGRPRGRGGGQARPRAPGQVRGQVVQTFPQGQMMTPNIINQQGPRGSVVRQQVVTAVRMVQPQARMKQPNQLLVTSTQHTGADDDFAHLRPGPDSTTQNVVTTSGGKQFQSAFLSFIQKRPDDTVAATHQVHVRPTTSVQGVPTQAVTVRIVRPSNPQQQKTATITTTQPTPNQPAKPVKINRGKKVAKPKIPKNIPSVPIGQQLVDYQEQHFDPSLDYLPQRSTSMRRAKENLAMTTALKRKMYDSDSSGEERDYDSDKDPGWMPFSEQYGLSDSDGEGKKKRKDGGKTPQKKKRHTTGTRRRSNIDKIDFTYVDTFGVTQLCQLGDFIVQTKALDDENFCIWKLDSGSLIQKFQPVDCEGALCHQATTTYSKWTNENKGDYQGVQVSVLEEDEEGPTLVQIIDHQEQQEHQNQEQETRPESAHPEPEEQATDQQEEQQDSDDGEVNLESDFFVLMQTLISQALEPGFIQTIIDEDVTYYLESLARVDQLIEDKKSSLLSTMEWSDRFLETVERRPYLNITTKQTTEHCQARVDTQETAIKSVELYGQMYDSISLETVNSGDAKHEEFLVGPGTAEILPTYHKLEHFKFSTYKRCIAKVELIREDDEEVATKDILDTCLKNRNWVLKMLEEFKNM